MANVEPAGEAGGDHRRHQGEDERRLPVARRADHHDAEGQLGQDTPHGARSVLVPDRSEGAEDRVGEDDAAEDQDPDVAVGHVGRRQGEADRERSPPDRDDRRREGCDPEVGQAAPLLDAPRRLAISRCPGHGRIDVDHAWSSLTFGAVSSGAVSSGALFAGALSAGDSGADGSLRSERARNAIFTSLPLRSGRSCRPTTSALGRRHRVAVSG